MERQQAEPTITLEGVRTYIAIVGGFVLAVWLAVVGIHLNDWITAGFTVSAWCAVATMGWRRLYPHLSNDELDAVHGYQLYFLAWTAGFLSMPAWKHMHEEHGVAGACVMLAGALLLLGSVVVVNRGLKPLPTRTHEVIACLGTWASVLLLPWLGP